MIKDSLGRDVMQTPATGPLWVYNRFIKNTLTTIVHHLSELNNILKTNPEVNRAVLWWRGWLVIYIDSVLSWTILEKSQLWHVNLCLSCTWLVQVQPNRAFMVSLLKVACRSFFASLCSRWRHSTFTTITYLRWNAWKKVVFSNALDALDSYWNGKSMMGFELHIKA